jgi:hypothetical protein
MASALRITLGVPRCMVSILAEDIAGRKNKEIYPVEC